MAHDHDVKLTTVNNTFTGNKDYIVDIKRTFRNFDVLKAFEEDVNGNITWNGDILAVGPRLQCTGGEFIAPTLVQNDDGSYTVEWMVVA